MPTRTCPGESGRIQVNPRTSAGVHRWRELRQADFRCGLSAFDTSPAMHGSFCALENSNIQELTFDSFEEVWLAALVKIQSSKREGLLDKTWCNRNMCCSGLFLARPGHGHLGNNFSTGGVSEAIKGGTPVFVFQLAHRHAAPTT